MGNHFAISAIISFIFFLAKFIEMRFINKKNKPLKKLFRDSLIVYFSVLIGMFVIDQSGSVQQGGKYITPIFTDNPGF
jgi:hypothetical protein